MKGSFSKVPSDIFPRGAFELKVSFERKREKREQIKNSLNAVDIARSSLYEIGSIEYAERFYIMLLDRNNQMYAYKLLSEGGMAGTVADPRLIFQTALLCHATGIILMHNHPSGCNKPSNEDILLTKRLAEAGKLLEIRIFDHIILTVDDYYSFANEGLL